MNARQLLFQVLVWVGLGASTASASIVVVLDSPAQSGVAGSTLHYFGTITNTGTTAVFLNGDSVNLLAAAADFSLNDLFFSNVPVSLAGAASSGDIELFAWTISSPFPDVFATYAGTYAMQGGADANAGDVLAQVRFTARVQNAAATPEPATAWLVLGGFSAILSRRQFRRALRLG